MGCGQSGRQPPSYHSSYAATKLLSMLVESPLRKLPYKKDGCDCRTFDGNGNDVNEFVQHIFYIYIFKCSLQASDLWTKTTPGTTCPTFYDECVGSLTSPSSHYSEGAGDRAYGLSSLSEKTRISNHLQISLQRQHILLSYFKILSVGPVWGLNPRPPAQQSNALPTELTGRHTGAFVAQNGACCCKDSLPLEW